MANNNYFVISGFLSLSFFIIICFLFVVILFDPSKMKTYGATKKNYISISLNTSKVKVSQAKVAKKSVVSKKTVQEVKNIDVNNLFNDVWTKKIEYKKETPKPKNIRRISDIQKKIATTQENDVESISQKLNSLANAKVGKEEELSSSAPEVNEYLAKIQAIVYQHFTVPHNTQGHSVKAVIELNAFGKVIDFRILQYSANDVLNAQADTMKGKLLDVVFPKNPNNKTSKTVVLLISKE